MMTWQLLARLALAVGMVSVAVVLAPFGTSVVVNAFGGVAVAAIGILLESAMGRMPLSGVVGAALGGTLGLVTAFTLGRALAWTDTADAQVAFLHGAVLLLLPYLGLVFGARHGQWLHPARLATLYSQADPPRSCKILDTSVVIDGRIADLCETGFIDGALVVPQFVLKELQFVADSGDPLKRNRGRRGLDILQKMQKMSGIEVIVSEVDFPDVREVDSKLIELALKLSGKIVTNDFNLNKVAQLRGIEVLNINELANALKPVVLPGEFMNVLILKEGKEYNQGVAYLDDGTMVVVDNARRLIGRSIDVVVTSVLQTTAGKMIFGRHVETGTAAPPSAAPMPSAPPIAATPSTSAQGNGPASGAATSRRPEPA
jgi:uncharacterized protein YacL